MIFRFQSNIEFNILVFVAGKVYDLGSGAAWPAVSGPYGKGKAPKGKYLVEVPVAIEAASNKSFTDTQGFAWFARITPEFTTERSGLGLHPDGGVEGTEGCIGIKGDTKAFFEILQGMKNVSLFVL